MIRWTYRQRFACGIQVNVTDDEGQEICSRIEGSEEWRMLMIVEAEQRQLERGTRTDPDMTLVRATENVARAKRDAHDRTNVIVEEILSTRDSDDKYPNFEETIANSHRLIIVRHGFTQEALEAERDLIDN